MWHIYFILWVSWAWKWTLIKNIKNYFANDDRLHIPLSYKTRTIRDWEIDWIDAYFISKEDFYSQVQAWEFLEYAMVHEMDYYGTKYIDVIDNGINKQKIVIKELDINWLENLKREKPELDLKYTTIFLNIPTDILKERIKKRWAFMSDEELQKRLNSSIIEEEKSQILCDFVIDATKSEDEVLNEFLKIVNKI